MNYPYYIAPLLKKLEANSSEEERNRLRMLIAVNVGDKDALRDLLGLDSESLTGFYPDRFAPDPSTDDAIRNFLDTYDPKGSAASTLNITPALNYASIMEAQPLSSTETETATPTSGTLNQDASLSAIDAFLNANPIANKRKTNVRETESPALTESFARILIKNGNYAKAIEIITELNLKNSEKSIYFADQIRFLKKLMINQQKNR